MKGISSGGGFKPPQPAAQSPVRAQLRIGATLPVSAVSSRRQRQRENLPDPNEALVNIINQLVDLLDDGNEQKKAEPPLKKYSFNTYRRCFLLHDVFRLVRVEVKNGREISVSFIDMGSPPADAAVPCNVPLATITDSK